MIMSIRKEIGDGNSQKCQYGVRAIYELAKNNGAGPLKIAEIARRQVIPLRFLEIILNELKRGGFIRALRGKDGGCTLARSAAELSVGEVMRFIEGSFAPVGCVNEEKTNSCPSREAAFSSPVGEGAAGACASLRRHHFPGSDRPGIPTGQKL